MTGTVGEASVTVKVTVRSNKELAALAAKEYDAKDYTAESYKAYETALANAKKVLQNADASQNEIDSAKDALQNAIDGLKKGQASSITISAPSEVYEGEKVQLKASGNGVSGKVKWSVSPKKNASINNNGVLHAKKAGTVQVTAKIKNYSQTVTIRVK